MRNFHFRNRSPLAVLMLVILLAGAWFFSKMQSALFPEITFPKIKIIADAGQQPVGKMMIAVTRPLENAIKKVPGLTTVRSTTSRGSCEISAFLDWNADINYSQQQIEARIAAIKADLPPNISINVERMNPSILPVMGYSLESKSRKPIDLKMMALYTIKPFLSQVKGVSEVRVIGGKTKEYWLTINQQKMNALGLTAEQIASKLSQSNFILSNGYLSDYRQMYLTVTDASIKTLEQLNNMVIANNGQRIVLLKDIASIQIEEAKEYIKINANGKESILIAIVKQPDANVVELSGNMHKKISDLQKILPGDVVIKPYYDQAGFINDAIKSVTDSLWVGLLLAIFVAVLFLRSVKASAVILFSIPITLALSVTVLYFLGQTLNIMTLGALAASIGLIIDDAIVVIEQIHRTHEEHPEEGSMMLVQKAIRYLFPAMLGSSLSTIVIFFPFVLMSGVAGAYFKVMTDTMIITLTCSFLVTWLLLPVLYLLMSRGNSKVEQHKIKPHHPAPQKWVSFFIRHSYISLLIVLLLTGAFLFVYPRLQTGFLPEMDEGSIVLDYSSPPGTSLEETDLILQRVEKLIVADPDVAAYSRRTGTQMGFFITEPNRGDYLIQLKKNRKKTTEEVIADLRNQIASTEPALRIDFGQVIGDMLGDLMESVQPIEIKIYGTDKHLLQDLSKKVAGIAEKVKGTADVFDGIVIAGPSIDIIPHYDNLALYGLTAANLQFQLQTALEGNIAGQVWENNQLSNIRLLYPGSRQRSVAELSSMQIALPDGRLKPLSTFASIRLNKGEAEITRDNLQNMGVVTARLENRDLGSTIKEIKNRIRSQVNLPQGYSIEYGGAYAEQQQSFRELLTILITASLLVFAVILFLFRDILTAVIILLIAVLGISGSCIALYITSTALNVGSYTGLIMIVGIIGENALFTQLQFRDSLLKGQSVDEAVLYAISTRLRPKLMTAIGAIIALLPIALGIGTGAQLHQPLAIAVIGGFVTALPLLLIVLPTLLRWRNRKFGSE